MSAVLNPFPFRGPSGWARSVQCPAHGDLVFPDGAREAIQAALAEHLDCVAPAPARRPRAKSRREGLR